MILRGPLCLTLNASLSKIFLRIFHEGNSLNLLYSLRGRHPSLLMNLILVEMITLRETQLQVGLQYHSFLVATNLFPIALRRRGRPLLNLLSSNHPNPRLRFKLNLSDPSPVSWIVSLLRVPRLLMFRRVIFGATKRVLQAPAIVEVIAKVFLIRPRQVVRLK